MKNMNIHEDFSIRMQEAARIYAERTYQVPEFDKSFMQKALHDERRRRFAKGTGAAAVAVLGFGACFGVGVNVSPAFADSVSEIPMLRGLAEVFTAEERHEETSVYAADVKIPAVGGVQNNELQSEINDLVKSEIEAVVEETKAEMEAEKEMLLSLGGSEEDYMVREILVDYEVYGMTEDYISFAVFKTETAASAYFDYYYYNYDLETGQPLTLEKLLGEGYEQYVNEQITEGIRERSMAEDAAFFEGEEGFTGITEDQNFYVNEKGNPVIVFNKYEIAPGYMGIQEFEITGRP